MLLCCLEDLCADRVLREFVKEIAGNFGEPHETPVIGRHELDATAQITKELHAMEKALAQGIDKSVVLVVFGDKARPHSSHEVRNEVAVWEKVF